MVRFIIEDLKFTLEDKDKFTFQYGQIYYKRTNYKQNEFYKIYIPIWLDLLFLKNDSFICIFGRFTFQYGQIYYRNRNSADSVIVRIYIPIWLDLLYYFMNCNCIIISNLHSNMVRFIIRNMLMIMLLSNTFTFQYGQIYYF